MMDDLNNLAADVAAAVASDVAAQPKLELPSNEKVRDVILSVFPEYGQFFMSGIAVSANRSGLVAEDRVVRVEEVIEGDRTLLHGKVDEVLDLLSDRTRLHGMLDAVLDAVIEHVGAEEVPAMAPEICSDCAAAGHGGGEG